ncbi:MAG: ATP-binding protein [Candidatus Krumholzibacteria bacterium]|jgi:two-component system phosphate regulon sensor histidine kinase PhoR|nr:ATP-binding protein [Candidatus Krumholzibacteria bacterium]
MKKLRIIWHLFPWYILIIFASLFAVSWFVSRYTRDFHRENIGRNLESMARLVDFDLESGLRGISNSRMDSICVELHARSGIRVTVVGKDGRVAGDSLEESAEMENHGDRPEIIKALSGGTGVSERVSGTLKRPFLYVAVPLYDQDGLAGAVRTSISMADLNAELRRIQTRIIMTGAAVAILSVLVSILISRRISAPLNEMKKGISHFAGDDLEYRIPVYGLAEVGDLAGVINEMASRLQDRIDTVELQRSEQEAVFAAMPGGILVVDDEERIVRMNPGASGLIGLSGAEAAGKMIQEAVRNLQLQKFVARTLRSEEPIEADLTLRSESGDVFIQAHGVKLRSDNGNRGKGAVIVLNDVTRIKRLENVRREFVANVSHELRTPITAIKGFVETLMDGGIDSPGEAKKFLGIIDRQADRMNGIVRDLLILAQVEREGEAGDIRFEKGNIRKILEEARLITSPQAAERRIIVSVDCDEKLEARVNSALLEQAVINLVENAIKYSDEGGLVRINASVENGFLEVDVIDQGCGIAPENLPRIFERFFRIDKARSRKLGGTGLGLSIVKHIAAVHGGSVHAESEPGRGSAFRLRIPVDSQGLSAQTKN